MQRRFVEQRVVQFHSPADVSDRDSAGVNSPLRSVLPFTETTCWPRTIPAMLRLEGCTDRRVGGTIVGLLFCLHPGLDHKAIGRLLAEDQVPKMDPRPAGGGTRVKELVTCKDSHGENCSFGSQAIVAGCAPRLSDPRPKERDMDQLLIRSHSSRRDHRASSRMRRRTWH